MRGVETDVCNPSMENNVMTAILIQGTVVLTANGSPAHVTAAEQPRRPLAAAEGMVPGLLVLQAAQSATVHGRSVFNTQAVQGRALRRRRLNAKLIQQPVQVAGMVL